MANRYSLRGDRRSSNPILSILRVIVQLLVIVSAIHIAFSIQRWNDSKQEMLAKQDLLQQLRAETSENLKALTSDQEQKKIQVELFGKLIIAASQQVSDDTLRMALDELLSYDQFSLSTMNLNSILAIGNLGSINDDALWSLFSDIQRFERTVAMQTANRELINNQIEPYLTRRQVVYLLELKVAKSTPASSLSVEQSARIIRTLLGDRTFIDLVYLRLSRLNETLAHQDTIVSRLSELLTLLEKELDLIEYSD